MFLNPSHTARTRASVLLLCLALAACALLACGTEGARAQSRPWAWQNPLPQGNAISAVRFAADGLNGWAVGAEGVVLRTRNGGFRWEEQKTPASVTLYGLFVKD